MKRSNYRIIAARDDRKTLAFEKKYAKRIRQALLKQVDSYFDSGGLSNHMYEVISDLYREMLTYWMPLEWKRLTNDEVSMKGKTGFFLEMWARYINEYILTHIAAKVVGIDNTTRQMIKDKIADGTIRGFEFEIIRDTIMTAFINSKRAMTIARTEVGQAVNEAKKKSSDDWEEETGQPLSKIWIHRGAKDPRDWHLAMDNGRQIPKKSKFIVTNPDTGKSEEMDYPHDPTASAENVINCGCQVMYVRTGYKGRTR